MKDKEPFDANPDEAVLLSPEDSAKLLQALSERTNPELAAKQKEVEDAHAREENERLRREREKAETDRRVEPVKANIDTEPEVFVMRKDLEEAVRKRDEGLT